MENLWKIVNNYVWIEGFLGILWSSIKCTVHWRAAELSKDWSKFMPVCLDINLSTTVAPGKNSVNMVDWKYSSFFPLDWITGLISRRPSSWKGVFDYGRIERGHGSISFIMHHQKPGAVFPASQRCSEGGQSVRSSHN